MSAEIARPSFERSKNLMAMEPVRRISTAEAVANHLVDLIRSREFGPGDTLPSERELQQKMSVGRVAVREGLARLSALGIIQVDHGKGARVREGVDVEAMGQVLMPLFPDRYPKALQDLLRARSAVDSELASLAAQGRTDEDLRILESLLDNPGRALTDDRALVDLDLNFHREVARIADNAYLTGFHEALAGPIKEYLLRDDRPRNRREVIDRHRPILEAIRAQDPAGARRAALDHLVVYSSSVDGTFSDNGST